MLRAAVSGRAAAAMIDADGEWYRIDGDRPSEIRHAAAHEWPYIFGAAEDIAYFNAETFDDVSARLCEAVDHEQGLALALICLDVATDATTRSLAAEGLARVIGRTPGVTSYLWQVFTAKPIPHDGSLFEAYRASTGDAEHLFRRLDEHQKAISLVHIAWQSIPDRLFARGINREELLAFAAHSGICAHAVESVHEGAQPNLLDSLEVPAQWRSSDVRTIFSGWSYRIAVARSERIAASASPTQVSLFPAWQEPPTLFAAAAPDLEELQGIDFHGSLINNLLLRRRTLIPDSYLFNSYGIAAHLAEPNTLLENALAAGLVIAGFRYRTRDFATAHRILRRQRYVGRPCVYLDRLQRAADSSGEDVFVYWSNESIDEKYDEYLSVLQMPEPPAAAQHATSSSALEKSWSETREWRMALIDNARTISRREGRRGIQKHVLFELLKSAVLGTTATNITSIRTLIAAGKELAERIRTFWSWVAEGHRFSRAGVLDAVVYSPGYEKVQNLFVTTALGSLGVEPLKIEVELPSTHDLKRIPPQVLIELRNGPGADFFSALQRWYESPDSRDGVRTALEQYANIITVKCTDFVKPLKPKQVQLKVGLPSRSTDAAVARRQQLLAMTTYDTKAGKVFHQLLPGGKVGPVVTNDQTDICVVTEIPA